MENSKKIGLLKKANVLGLILLPIGIILLLISLYVKDSYKFDFPKYDKWIGKVNTALKPYTNLYSTQDTMYALVKNVIDSVNEGGDFSYIYVDASSFLEYVEVPDSASNSYFLRKYKIKLDSIGISAVTKLKSLADSNAKSENFFIRKGTEILGSKFINKYPIRYSVDTSNTQYKLTYISVITIVLSLLIIVVTFILIYFFNEEQKKISQKEMASRVQEEHDKNPDAMKPSWDMAQLTLELYYKRNLFQINLIFIVSVAVMIAGFILISVGISVSFGRTDNKLILIVSTASGILTELIGATFIYIYNSTIKQAISYTGSLEKINSVGMTMKILDSIKTDEGSIKELNNAKIEIAKLLIQQSGTKPAT